MFKSVAKKVAWVGRTASMVFGLALVMALVFGVATMAMGATGGNFLLGKKNVADAISTLVKKGPGPALNLVVEANQPPMRVNSPTQVANLNADLLDGKHAADFLVANQKADDSDKLDGLDSTQLKAVGRSTRGGNCTADAGTQTCAQTTINLPASGRVLLNSTGSWWAYNSFPASGILTGHCILKEERYAWDISGTDMFIGERQSVSGARPIHTAFSPGSQAVTYVTDVLPAGQNTFQVRCTQTEGDIDWGSVTLSAVTLGDG
jgi:hypothetical protein